MMEIRFWRREKLCRTFVLGTGLVLASAFLFSEPLYSAVRAEISTAGTPAAVASDALVADIQGGRTLSLAALDEMALANHPAIQAYEQKICALNGRWQQAGLGPNPEIGYKWEEFNEDAPGGNQVLEFSQEILGGSQLYHAQAHVSQQIETVRQELEIAKFRVLTDVRVAVYEYLAIDLTREQFDLYDLPVDYEPNQEISLEYCGRNKDTLERYRQLQRNIMRFLNPEKN